MTPDTITPIDRVRWICKTSAEEGVQEIRRLQRDKDMTPSDMRAIFVAARDYEDKHQQRVSLVTALNAAINRIDKEALKTGKRVCIRKLELPEEPAPVEVLAPDTAAPDTAALIQSINANHLAASLDAAQARALGESAVRRAIIAGLQLIQLKDATPHGHWESLFSGSEKRVKSNGNHDSHLLGFDRRTALKYIAVATQLVSKKLQPEQSQALMALAAGADLDEGAQHLLDEITPPKSLRQTYLELGIVKPTPKEAAWLHAESPAETDPAKAGKLSPAEQLRSLRESARKDWFGLAPAGQCAPGSIASMLQTELDHPERGSLRMLPKADLEILADFFRRAAKSCADYAKDK